MKQLFCLVAVLMVAMGTVSAEGTSPVFYGGAGIGMLVKPSSFISGLDLGMGDMYKSGANFGGGVGFQLSPMFELVGRVSYGSYTFDDEGLLEKAIEEIDAITALGTNTGVAAGGKLKVLELLADFKFLIPVGEESGAFRPFLLGGLGFGNVKIDEWNLLVTNDQLGPVLWGVGPEISETKLLFNIGAGFDWMASPRLGVFADIRYAQVALAGDPIGYVPVRVGLMFKIK